MTYQERSSKSVPNVTGLFASLRAFLRRRGANVPSHRRVAAGAAVTAAVALALLPGSALAREAHVFSTSFGSVGSGAGQLELAPVSFFGEGEVLGPGSGLGIDQATGDVYVADTGNDRLDQFSASGSFIRAWGWGVKNGASEFQICTQVTGCQAGVSGSGTGQFKEAAFVAVDNSGGPSAGDVYVADPGDKAITKFEADGSLLASWGSGGQKIGTYAPAGVTVDSAGNLVVLEAIFHGQESGGNSYVRVYDQAGALLSSEESGYYGNAPENVALASNGDLFRVEPYGTPQRLSGSLQGKVTQLGCEAVSGGLRCGHEALGLASDIAANKVYVAQIRNGGVIDGFAADCEGACPPFESFGEGNLSSPAGLAVASSHAVYVADTGHQRIAVFVGPVTLPDLTTSEATELGQNSAELTGTVNPDGVAVTECYFEYGETAEYGHTSPCSPGPGQIGSASKPVEVHTQLSGLDAYRSYHYRLVVANGNGSSGSTDKFFTTLPAPEVPSSCANEQLRIENNSDALPDCRAYELVSSADATGEVYVPNQATNLPTLKSTFATRAAADGNGVAYIADPPVAGGNGNQGNGLGDQFRAIRGAEGWVASVLTPTDSYGTNEAGYQAFSEDLTTGVLYVNGPNPEGEIPSLSAEAPADCQTLYSHLFAEGDANYRPLFSETQETQVVSRDKCGRPLFAGANSGTGTVPAGSRSLFQTEAALSPGDKAAIGSEVAGERCSQGCNLYASFLGQAELIDRLPKGEQASGATFGGPGLGPDPHSDFAHVISADGSRIFWTDTSTDKIYVRENVGAPAAKTVQVSVGKAQYWTATTDGRFAYYTENGALMRFDVQGEAGQQRETIISAAASVQGVVGVNETGEDGSYLYFVAEGKLSADAEARSCTVEGGSAEENGHLVPGKGCNLYLLHGGETKLIGALAAKDNQFSGGGAVASQGVLGGDWIPDLGARTAELTPDGHDLIFQSIVHLARANGDVPAASIFDYDADSGLLSCVSCNASGAPLQAESGVFERDETTLPINTRLTYQRRLISADGSRVFFETTWPLVPGDTNGLEDVYEWQRQGSAACPESSASPVNNGCLRLLSDGGGNRNSFLLEASVSGDDVFIITNGALTPNAGHEQERLFDARVDGGFPAVAAVVPCESTEACHGAGSTPPPARSPGTSTFQANEPPLSASCKKGTVRKGGKCVKKDHKSKKRHGKHGKAGANHGGGK